MITENIDPRRAGSCFVIATRNRPDYLLTAVRSLVEQTVLPQEVCIVDSSAEAPTRAEIETLCANVGLRLDYMQPAPRGLTVQRNMGIDRTTGDPVFLINDDVWNWHTTDFKAHPKTSFDYLIGVVFRVVRDEFPDPTWNKAKSRWMKVEMEMEKSPAKPAKLP